VAEGRIHAQEEQLLAVETRPTT